MSPVTLLLIAVFFFRLAFWYADLSFYQNWFGYKRICVPNCADVLALDFFWFFSSFPSLSYIAKILLMDCVKAARLSLTSNIWHITYSLGQKSFMMWAHAPFCHWFQIKNVLPIHSVFD